MKNLNALKSYGKIIHCQNGVLRFDQENLNRIVENFFSQYEDLPIAFLTVIGPPNSGKSFLTNLLTYYLGKHGEGGWMGEMLRDGKFLEGFSFGSVNASETLLNVSDGSSGIYLWPTPFLMTKDDGTELLVGILHYCVPENSSSYSEDVTVIEKYLGLACSRVVEINSGNDKFRLGRIKQSITSSNISISTSVCNSVVLCLLADKASRPGGSKILRENDAKKEILQMRMSVGGGRQLEESMLDEFSYLNLMRIKKCSDPLHDENGYFNQKAMATMAPSFKNLFSIIMEGEEILPKRTGDENLITVSKIQDYLNSCVGLVNQSRSAKESPSLNQREGLVTSAQVAERKERSLSSSSSESGSLASALNDSDPDSNIVMTSDNHASLLYAVPIETQVEASDKLSLSSSSSSCSGSLESFQGDSGSDASTKDTVINRDNLPDPDVTKTITSASPNNTVPTPVPRTRTSSQTSLTALKVDSPEFPMGDHFGKTDLPDLKTDTANAHSASHTTLTYTRYYSIDATTTTTRKPDLSDFTQSTSDIPKNVDPDAATNLTVPLQATNSNLENDSSSYYSSSSESSSYESDINEEHNDDETCKKTTLPPVPIIPPKRVTLNLDMTQEVTNNKEKEIEQNQDPWRAQNVVRPALVENVSLGQARSSENGKENSNKEFVQNEMVLSQNIVHQDLGPLIIRLGYNEVTMGSFLRDQLTPLTNHKGEIATPIIVGINEHGNLVCGTDAMTQCFYQNPPLSHWWITEFFTNDRFNSCRNTKTFMVGRKQVVYEISVEFLLGYFLKYLRNCSETLLNGRFSSAVITVPLWFCSTHRIQVKTAAEVAGFPNVRLINEESAAAYSCAFVNRITGVISTSGNVLVLSENCGVVDAILYSYSTQNRKKLTMIAHAFAKYSSVESKKGKRSEILDETKLQTQRMKAKTTLVTKVCNALFKQKIQWNKKDPMHVIFLTGSDMRDSEDVEWIHAFEKVVTNKGYGGKADVGSGTEKSSMAVMSGALMLSQVYLQRTKENLEEQLVYDVFKHSLSDRMMGDKAISKKDFPTLPVQSKPESIVILKSMKSIKFYQRSMLNDCSVFVGELNIGPSISDSRKVYPILDISSEGIITLKEVQCDPGRYRPSSINEITTDFIWTIPNAGETQKTDISKFIDLLIQDYVRMQSVSEA